jgi:hypothetical protein
MQWRRIDPIQPVGALFATGAETMEQAETQLASKSPLFQQLKQVRGEDWLAYFAVKIPADDGQDILALPHITVMQALYEEATGWWLPVGTEMAVAPGLRADLRQALCAQKRLKPPFILIPRFQETDTVTCAADVYELA